MGQGWARINKDILAVSNVFTGVVHHGVVHVHVHVVHHGVLVCLGQYPHGEGRGVVPLASPSYVDMDISLDNNHSKFFLEIPAFHLIAEHLIRFSQ